MPESKMERIKRCIVSSAHHRDQLEANFDELLITMGYLRDSYEADTMADVVFNGRNFYEALEAIARYKLRQLSGK